MRNGLCAAAEARDTPGCGVVFELVAGADKTNWTERVIYRFCAQDNCADGFIPVGTLAEDKDGNLYGAAQGGGICADGNPCGGVIYELTPDKAKTHWVQTVLYRFCSGDGCHDGSGPGAGVVLDQYGNLYGTTVVGGKHHAGIAFELSPNADSMQWTETVLYEFCSAETKEFVCADGRSPRAVTLGADGALYGSAEGSTIRNTADVVTGIVFQLTPPAKTRQTGWDETILYSFCTQSHTNHAICTPRGPVAGNLIQDADGNLYGVLSYSGGGTACPGDNENAPTCGTVFELSPGQVGEPSHAMAMRTVARFQSLWCPMTSSVLKH